MYALDIRKDQWSFDVETVTPEKAVEILAKCNRGNRKLRIGTVAKYARMMALGQWRLSPEAIVISRTGRLLNGQHRLSAVVQSGVSVRFLTIRGPDDDVFSVLDRGAIRTTADALGSEKRETEVARLITLMGGLDARIKPNDPDVARALALISDTHRELVDACNSHAQGFSSAPFRLAAVARIMNGDNRDYVLSLYRDLVLANIDNLPPIGVGAVRAKMQGRINATGGGGLQIENAGMAWSLFDPKKKDNERLVHPKNRQYIREILEAVGYESA